MVLYLQKADILVGSLFVAHTVGPLVRLGLMPFHIAFHLKIFNSRCQELNLQTSACALWVGCSPLVKHACIQQPCWIKTKIYLGVFPHGEVVTFTVATKWKRFSVLPHVAVVYPSATGNKPEGLKTNKRAEWGWGTGVVLHKNAPMH